VTLDGEQRIADFTLLGYYDATIARYDYWVDGQYRYEIIELAPTCDYEVKALVERRG
jgi:hypothetical protein